MLAPMPTTEQARRIGRRAAVAASVLAALGGSLALGGPGARDAAPRAGPYPSLGSCPVFPDPPASTPARAPSLPTEAAWNQNVSKAPLARNSRSAIAYINSHGG